jgi:hypothetical protein
MIVKLGGDSIGIRSGKINDIKERSRSVGVDDCVKKRAACFHAALYQLESCYLL